MTTFHQSRVELIDFHSNILEKRMVMTVYLPKDYENFNSLPTLYFLHGRSGDEHIMFETNINTTADKLIEKGEIEPLIIVCPRLENSRGINSSPVCKEIKAPADSRTIHLGMYEDYFIKEIIPFVDKTFNTVKDKTGRYIGGASAGGYEALHYSFRHPRFFSKVGGHMPAIELKLEEEDMAYYNDLNTWKKYDPIHIARINEIPIGMKVYLDAGDKDEGQFYEGCSLLHQLLTEKGISVQNHIFPGNHSVEYIQSNIERYLLFYGN